MRKLLFIPTAIVPGQNAVIKAKMLLLVGLLCCLTSLQGFSQAYTITWTGLVGNNNATGVPTGINVTTQFTGIVATCSTGSNGATGTYTATVQAAPGYNFTITTVNGTAYASNAGSKGFQLELTNNGSVFGPATVIGSSSSCGGNTAFGPLNVPAANQMVLSGNSATITVLRTAGGAPGTGYSLSRSLTISGVVSPAGPMLTLSSPNPSVPASYVGQGTTSNIIYAYQAALTGGNTTLNSLAFTTAGNYAAADIDKFQLWYSSTNNFATAAQVGTDITTSLGVGVHTFTAIAQSVPTAQTGYYWITADVDINATITDSIKVNAIVPANLSYATGSTVVGTTSGGLAKTILVAPGKSTLTNDGGASTFPSISSTQVTGVAAFTFTFTDDGTTPAYDALDSKISSIAFKAGTGFSTITDWTQAILGAELTDGTTSFPVTTIKADSLIFTGIPHAGAGDLGFIADDGSKNYSLRIWLKPSPGGTLPTTMDNKNIVFATENLGFTIVGSQLDMAQNINSGFANNIFDVTATKLSIVTQPPAATDINLAMNPAVVYAATDANGNRDLDYTSNIDITSTGTLAGTSTNTATAVAGLASFPNIVHSAIGTGLELNATSGGLTAAPASNTFVIYNSTDHYRSAVTLAGDWSSAASWESSADSITWVPAAAAPGINAASIDILTGDTIIISTGVALDNTVIKSGAVLTIQPGATAYTINDNVTGDDMVIENGGMLLVKSQSVAIGGTGTLRVKTGGQIVIALTAASTTITGFYAASTLTRVIYEDGSIFNFNSTAATLSATASLFNTGATDMPILRINALNGSSFGSTTNITVNGRIEANTSFSIASTGEKTIRGGITGTGTVTQLTTGGTIYFESPNAILGGTVKLVLGTTTTNGLVIKNGLTIPVGSNVGISGAATIRCTKWAGSLVINGILDLGTTVLKDTAGTTVVNGTLRTSNPAGLSGGTTTAYVVAGATSSLTLNPGSKIEYYTSGAQTVSARTDYQDVTISGTGTKTLAGPATVAGVITLGGKLALSASDLTLLTSASITGVTSANYIQTNGAGSLKQQVAATSVLFPIGNSAYDPAILANAGTTDVFAVKVMDDVLSQGTIGSTLFNPVVKRSWTVAEDVAGGSDITMTLQWNAAEHINLFDVNHVYVSSFTGTGWNNFGINTATAPAAGGTDPYTVTKANITTFTQFTVGSAGILPLAITLNDLRAEAKGLVNIVNWNSATENEGNGYVLEHSADANAFTTLATINGKGNNSSYAYTDNAPYDGMNYYRLKLMDAKGNFTYSKTVSVNRKVDATNVVVMPNPVKDMLLVKLNNAEPCQLILTNMVGKTQYEQTVTGQATIDMSSYPAGHYLLKCSFGNDVQVIHISK